jgi:hypothetical protein
MIKFWASRAEMYLRLGPAIVTGQIQYLNHRTGSSFLTGEAVKPIPGERTTSSPALHQHG